VSFIFELIGQFLFQSLAYGVGKVIAAVFLPNLKIEPLQKQESMPPWKLRGFTYERGSQRYLYTESIQLLGICTLVLVALVAILMVHYAN
jgi:hypothetical protein